MTLNDDYNTIDDDDTQELIVNLSFGYGSGEEKDHLNSEEQCQELLSLSMMGVDRHEDMFLQSIERIAITVGDHLSQQKVSDKQMMRYVAEFDTWLSHTVDILELCDNAPHARFDNVMHLVRCCIFTKWDYAKEKITETLAKLYAHDTWREPMGVFFENGPHEEFEPDAMAFLSGMNRLPRTVMDVHDRINLYITILNMAGEDPRRMCKMYWMRDGRICAAYFLHLLERDDRQTALRVASVGLEMFTNSGELAAAILESFDTHEDATATSTTIITAEAREDLLLRARCRMYATSLDHMHYEMAKASASWNKCWAQNLAAMLAASGNHEAEILVLVDAGMHKEAVDALRYNGTLKAAISHRQDLVASHPDEYYEACRALVENAPKYKMGKAHQDMMRQCLRAMKYVPGRESDFEEFCCSLLSDSMPSALRNMIKKVASLS